MPWPYQKGLFESNRILSLPVTALSPNPAQPRTSFSATELEELAASIHVHGILQPLSVRKTGKTYQIVAGERRWRAAQLAGLQEVPCLVVRVTEEDSSLLALIENVQRQDLDFLDEATALALLLRTHQLSQEEVARRLGKSQSSIANKLRVLRLSTPVLTLLQSNHFTQRHGRALLPLEHNQPLQLETAQLMVDNHWTVAHTEEYVAALLAPKTEPKKKPTFIIKDVRLFLNTVTKGLTMMQSAGVHAICHREETDDSLCLTISIPKQKSK